MVQLRQIPVVRPFGVHTYFLVHRGQGGWERWELLGRGGRNHVNRYANAGGFGSELEAWIVREWTGRRAERILEQLNREAADVFEERFPRYGLAPGPNSNTWPAWVLRRARVGHDFDDRAIGRYYPGWFSVGLTPSRSGVHLDTPLVGIGIGVHEGVEFHILHATVLGVDFWPPALQTLVGRIGAREPHVVAGEGTPHP